jgi:small subunit ribosomal protein S9
LEDKGNTYYATGKRKNAIARIWLERGTGNVTVNHRAADQFFGRETLLMIIQHPINISNLSGQFDIRAQVKGGGSSGQAGAVQHAISKALLAIDPALRDPLKKEGLLTRDSRVKERKKYGQKGARKRFQFSKR